MEKGFNWKKKSDARLDFNEWFVNSLQFMSGIRLKNCN